ncbi:MAG TPA: hypothetical protein VGQ89_08340 [Candidatus Limnocylindrales bacterium]|jgi:hypothetical protein|nr:hypothetical protein [Candidatus Limnocylindrales bacterium]
MFGVTWAVEDTFVVAYRPDRDASLFRLATVEAHTGSLTELPEPLLGDCHRQRLLEPERLPDLRVAFIRVCQPEARANAVEHSVVMALDLETGTTTILADLDPYSQLVGQYAPTRGPGGVFAAVGSQLCETIVKADERGAVPISAELRDGARAFRLDDPTALAEECSATGWATQPTLNPTAPSLALFAAPSAAGVSGFDRAGVPANLYVLDVGRGTSDLILSGVRMPRGLHYSPDGRALAFAGSIDGRSGTWVYRLGAPAAERVSDLRLSWLGWSPDGMRIVGLVGAETSERPLDKELWILELAKEP